MLLDSIQDGIAEVSLTSEDFEALAQVCRAARSVFIRPSQRNISLVTESLGAAFTALAVITCMQESVRPLAKAEIARELKPVLSALGLKARA